MHKHIASPTSRAGRLLATIAVALVVLVVLLAGLALLASRTEWGAHLLWQVASRVVPGQLTGEFAGGTLSDGVMLRNVVYRDEKRLIKIDRLESNWHLFRSPLTLEVRKLLVGTSDVTLFHTAPTQNVLPQKIVLPLAIDLQSVSIRQLVIHRDLDSAQANATRIGDIRLHAHSDRVRHSLVVDHAMTPYGIAATSLQLDGMPPFALAGTASLTGAAQQQRYQIDAQLTGTLQVIGVQLDAEGDKLKGHAIIDATPFSAVPFRGAQIDIRHLNPKTFNAGWPQADLDLRTALTPGGTSASAPSPSGVQSNPQLIVTGTVSVANADPGPLDKSLLPLLSARADVTLDTQTQKLSQLHIALSGNAALQGSGILHGTEQGDLTLRADRLDLHAVHAALHPTQLHGPLTVHLAGNVQHIDLDLVGASLSVTAQATLDPKQIALRSATLRAGAAQLAFSGTLARDAQAAYSVRGKLTDFNPALFFFSMQHPGAQGSKASRNVRDNSRINARINSDVEAEGTLHPDLIAHVRFKVHDSSYDNLPMTGGGALHVEGRRLQPSDAQLVIAGNSLRLKGSFGAPSDSLTINLDAPALDRLGFGLSGLLHVNGGIGGTLTRPVVDVSYQAEKLAFGAYRLSGLSGQAHIQGLPGTAPDAQVRIALKARGMRSSEVNLEQLNANIDGTYANHTLHVDASGLLRGRPLALTLAAQGRLQQGVQDMAWDGEVRTLENRGLPRVVLDAPLRLNIAPGRFELGAGRLRIAQATVDLKNFRYDDRMIRSEGAFSALNIGHLFKLRQQFTGVAADFETDLVLDGRWNLTLTDSADGFVQIERHGGDVRLPGGNALGLTALSLRANLQADRVNVDARFNAERIGKLAGQGKIVLQRAGARLELTPQSPLSAHVTASIPNLQTIAALAGPGIALNGSAAMNLTLSGTLGDPVPAGSIAGDRLAVTLYEQGVRLRDGIARLRLDNNIVELQQLEFHGGSGTLRASGRLPLDRASRELTATIVADKLQLLASPTGQLTLSGQALAANANGQLQLTGKFIVDHARFSLPETTAPRLDDDVVVMRGGKPHAVVVANGPGTVAQPASPFTPHVDIELGLGNDFRFTGSGADLLLAGTLMLKSEPGLPPRAFGTVNVVKGSYEAFGAKLAIEHGVINFQGPLRNPTLNVLAMRRMQEVAAGVQITGSVRQPRVQLVSEPDLPKEQKLSWLVFGHASGGNETGQAQAVARGAALGLLNKFGSGRVAKSFGLDTLSLGESKFGLNGAQVVNLGKEISDRLSIGYEQSLAGAENVLRLTYTLTQAWSVVLRGGTVSGVEVLYSKRFDNHSQE